MELFRATKRPDVTVFVVVYNRVNNVERWLRCWKQCAEGARLHIIKNSDPSDEEVDRLCREANVRCTIRPNVGYDMGVLQDICRGRLAVDPFDAMIWCADDMLPMRKDWWQHIIHALMAPDVGIASTHISWEFKRHVRTSGFAIRRETAEKLVFPADPITTKDECYDFEHRGGNTLLDQVTAFGLEAVQVSKSFDDLLWDTDHFSYITDNLSRFRSVFG